jgi:hypothetical protein
MNVLAKLVMGIAVLGLSLLLLVTMGTLLEQLPVIVGATGPAVEIAGIALTAAIAGFGLVFSAVQISNWSK